ncbi:MAG TPA: glycosyltransferase family 2 protein [Burkholderiales bacterium]|nr:glycosyltransferase family 2 protein [Burkholderiales bacterium]
MDSPRIDILLATRNGARLLEAQIDSLLSQEDVSFRILVRDDKSSDDTPAIIERYRVAHPDLITFLDSGEELGALGNFARLLGEATAPYVALSDQDDVWAARKLRTLLSAMRDLEARHGADTPLLIHCDLSVVDDALRELQPSFWRYSGFDPERTSLARLLLKNTVTGCASLVNLPLVRLALPVPAAALLHDYWLALVAAAAGRMALVRQPLVAYRQHARNVVGAREYGWRPAIARLTSGAGTWDIEARRRQTAALLERCGARLTPENRTVLEDFISLPERNWLGRRWTLLRHGIVMPGAMRNLALFFLTKLGA